LKEYLSPDQVVDQILLGYSRDSLYKLIQRKQIPHYRLPGSDARKNRQAPTRILLRRDEVERWAEQYRVRTSPPKARRR